MNRHLFVPVLLAAASATFATFATSAILPAQDHAFVADHMFADTGSEALAAAQRQAKQLPTDKKSFAKLAAALRLAGRFPRPEKDTFTVTIPKGPKLEVFLHLPQKYEGRRPWPLILAFGGGPIPKGRRGDRMSRSQAVMMRRVWQRAANKAGWLVATVRDDISRSAPGIRYEVVRPWHLELILHRVRRHLNVDEDRTFMTGISLGSNYSLACGAARPDLFCGAVPVATEGEGREPLLRNLRNYPLYVLVGSQDRNIKTIGGPRALDATLTRLRYAHVYEEAGNRGHEGFSDRYDDVLKWIADRPRRFWAEEVLRVPHDGILAADRSFYWVACDTRQGLFRARADRGTNTIHVDAAHLGQLSLLLSDELVDLDRKVRVKVNGKVLFDGKVARDPAFGLGHARRHLDRRRLPAARLAIRVPASLATGAAAAAFAKAMGQQAVDKPPLAYWEQYALRHLTKTRKRLGIAGEVQKIGDHHLGLRVTEIGESSPAAASGLRQGDVVVAFDANRFFSGDAPKKLLDRWVLREQFDGQGPELTVLRAGEKEKENKQKKVKLRVVLRERASPW